MSLTSIQKRFFVKQLMEWHTSENERMLPWKSEKDPYKIWLSEVILQQTRAEQGLPYYLRFIEAYPTIRHLAEADDEAVYRLWQGLGYYTRCKNLLVAARVVCDEFEGSFPASYDQIIRLNGVGAYTAAAIASFAFDLPHSVVDGNVYRLLSRFFGVDVPADTSEGKKLFRILAQELLVEGDSAGYNQAIMDYGATVCKPLAPSCDKCVLGKKCTALKLDLVSDLPVKRKKLVPRRRYFHYLLFICDDKLWIRKRTEKDIWQNLFEPFLIEGNRPIRTDRICRHAILQSDAIKRVTDHKLKTTQRLTHQIIEARFFSVQVDKQFCVPGDEGSWVPFQELKKFAFPKTLLSFLEKKLYF